MTTGDYKTNKTPRKRGFVFLGHQVFKVNKTMPVIPAQAGIQGFFAARWCFNFAGGSPTAGDFLLLAQKKIIKEKGALVRRPCGLPCAARPAGRLRNSPSQTARGLRQSSPTPPGVTALLGGSQGGLCGWWMAGILLTEFGYPVALLSNDVFRGFWQN